MAFTKQEKKELISNYENWLKTSRAAFILSYHKMKMQDIDVLRAEVREIGGEFHVVKNTLMNIALKNSGFENIGIFDESSIVALAFEDVPAMAKVVDKANSTELFSVKGGYMDGRAIKASDILSLAKLPPLPQMRAQLLAFIQTPAAQLVRTLAEPARQFAHVMKAYAEKTPV